MTPTHRRLIVWFVVVVTLGIVAWIAVRDASMLETIKGIPLEGFLILVGTQVIFLALSSRRFELVVEAVSRRELPWLGMLSIFAVGRALNLLFPQLGNAYRGVRLNTTYGLQVSLFAGALGAFVWMTVVLSAVTASVVLGVVDNDLAVGMFPAWLVMTVVSFVVLVTPVAVFALGKKLIDLDSPAPIRRKIVTTVEAAVQAATDPALLVRFGLTWAAALAVVVPMYRLTFSLVDHHVTLGQMVALFALVQATSFVVVTPGNLGIQDLGFVGVAVAFGIPASAAAGAAGLIRASGILALFATAAATGWHDLRTALATRSSLETDQAGSTGSD